ncbi:MAG: glutathione S-transferase [Oleiphilaceae bacterium]|nr:glutathione S-transferase [Oleiphilaceae bacterium]
MLTVHHLNNSRSQRILWCLEELELDYQMKRYERDPVTIRAPQSLKDVHPLGKSPVITDGDKVIAESGAIIEYLLAKDAQQRFTPSDEQALIDYRYWLHFSEGSLMPPLVMRLVFEKMKTSPMPFFVKPVAKGIADKVLKTFVMPEVRNMLAYINDWLEKREWFAGNALSGADFQMSFPLEASVARGLVDDRYPHIRRYVNMFQDRPAYLRALSKGGDYDYGPQ